MQMGSKNYVLNTFKKLRQDYILQIMLELRQKVTLD